MATQYTFLEQFMLKLLAEHGFDKLSKADQEMFFPQFMAEAEKRLGLVLAPRLTSKKAVESFNQLLGKNTSPEDWAVFWQKEVPDFKNIVQQTLTQFVGEVAAAFAS